MYVWYTPDSRIFALSICSVVLPVIICMNFYILANTKCAYYGTEFGKDTESEMFDLVKLKMRSVR